MLTGNQIRAAGLIAGALPAGFRASSYDVHIGQIVAHDGKLHSSYDIPPQGIVQVISSERIELPTNITGIATVKTALCNDGLLALNIGIVDPGYLGRISSFLINFSSVPRHLWRGLPFLRLQFEAMSNAGPPPVNLADNLYVATRRDKAHQFGTTFMNLSDVVDKATQVAFKEWKRNILSAAGAVGVFAFVLAVFTYFLNFGTLNLVKGWLQPADTVRAELFRGGLHDEIARLAESNAKLETRLRELEGRVPPSAGAH